MKKHIKNILYLFLIIPFLPVLFVMTVMLFSMSLEDWTIMVAQFLPFNKKEY